MHNSISFAHEITVENHGLKCSTLLYLIPTPTLLGGYNPNITEEKLKACVTLAHSYLTESLSPPAPPSLQVN